uniref:H(+)-transporting two-sector ATPase n=1 Tax=Chloroparvula japonica TaxID=1411623 RepID=A0A4D6C500_9CHLO|nr:ATP synthase F0 subunit 8 [Chloroparvula japonica]QBX98761.1 ATP synthase F0 subunit 8 [Chloroparvula japonica]
MPQLDHVSFFSQFFWLCIFFFSFYVGLLKGFMPKMSRLLKLRSAKTGDDASDLQVHENEQTSVYNAYNTMLTTSLNTCKQSVNNHFENTQDWLTKKQQDAHTGPLKGSNTEYLTKLGQTCLAQRLVLAQLDVCMPPVLDTPSKGATKTLYTHCLVNALSNSVSGKETKR